MDLTRSKENGPINACQEGLDESILCILLVAFRSSGRAGLLRAGGSHGLLLL